MAKQDEIAELRELIARLTERVYHLEQQVQRPSSLAELGTATQPSTPPPPAQIPPAPIATIPIPNQYRPPLSQPESLERRIGSQWLNRVGVVAVLVGVSYFLKLAFDYGWIGPGLRVLLGLVAGAGLCWWSERFRRPSSLAFSYSLKAVGVGVLYLSLWASFQLYSLIPGTIAFLAMIVVTAATAAMAFAQDAELLAGLALVGGLLTPVLCSTGENHEAALFSYLLLLSFGAFVLQRVKPWPRILFGAFVGSALLAAGWFDKFYTDDQFAESLLFFTLLFALFTVAPLYSILEPERDRPTRQTGLLLAIFNAAAYFTAIYSMLLTSGRAVQPRAAAYSFGLAIVYLSLALALERRISEHPGVERLLALAHYGLAISFLTVGLALKLQQHWITLGWLLEGAMLFWAGVRTSRARIKLFAVVVVALGTARLLTLDLMDWGLQPPIFNARFATFVVAIAVLLWMIYLDRGADRTASGLGVIVVNLLALLASGMEIHDYFQLSINAQQATGVDVVQIRHSLIIAQNFSYSALFMFYGAALMWIGFARKSAVLRWQAILLIGVTVLKVFLFDVSELEHAWRVLSFIILGVLLLAVSYAYQRDRLGLQRPHAG